MTEWRPDDWGEIKVGFCNGLGCASHNCYPSCPKMKNLEVVASAMLSALLKWLDEPCGRHPQKATAGFIFYAQSRINCPSCMAELRGEK